MKYAIIDAESSGLFDYSKPADAEGQPRVASFGLILLNEQFILESEVEYLIKPDGWVMGAKAGAVNGLTIDRLNAEGVPIPAKDILVALHVLGKLPAPEVHYAKNPPAPTLTAATPTAEAVSGTQTQA